MKLEVHIAKEHASTFAFASLGIPLRVRIAGRSPLFSFVAAIADALTYCLLVMRLGQVLVVQGILAPFNAAWVTFAVTGTDGVWMIVRLTKS